MTLAQQLKGNAAKIILVALFAIPAIRAASTTDQSATENRRLAAFPAAPSSWQETLKYPAKLDTWINDHFGYRDRFLKLNNRVRHALFEQFPTAQVIAGRDDRIFLSTHEAHYAPYAAIHLTCGYRFGEHGKIAEQINAWHAAFKASGIDARLLIAPSSPALYVEELPGWLAAQCRSAVPPIAEILKAERLPQPVRSSVYYPLEELRAAGGGAALVPKTWFHLTGAGSRLLAEKSVARFSDANANSGAGPALKTRMETQPSDLSHLFPGVRLASEVEAIDFAASEVTECAGGKCYPEMQEAMEKLGDVSRYRNTRAAKGSLIILSDSFGRYSAPWFSRYYRDVMHVSTNAADRLSASEMKQLREWLLEQGKRGEVLFLYHDAGVLAGRVGMDLKKIFPDAKLEHQVKS